MSEYPTTGGRGAQSVGVAKGATLGDNGHTEPIRRRWPTPPHMNPTAYIETSVVSYLAARPSRDVVVAAYREVTREW